MLAGVIAADMPYGDLHTAGPGLRALRHSTTCEFEVSATVVEGAKAWRLGFEALAISLYRQATDMTPTINFGRMPAGYRQSSGNNAKLVAAGKRFQGGFVEERLASHESSIPPIGRLDSDPASDNWCGHSWSPWMSGSDVAGTMSGQDSGLYRVRSVGADVLLRATVDRDSRGSLPRRDAATGRASRPGVGVLVVRYPGD